MPRPSSLGQERNIYRQLLLMRHVHVMFLAFALIHTRLLRFSVPCFARVRRNRNCVDREKAGLGWHTSTAATSPAAYQLTSKAQTLFANIVDAGKAGKLPKAKDLFACYAGSAPQIYNAIITAAFRCGEYVDGYDVYSRKSSIISLSHCFQYDTWIWLFDCRGCVVFRIKASRSKYQCAFVECSVAVFIKSSNGTPARPLLPNIARV